MTTSNKSTAILPPIKVQDVDQQLRGLVGVTYQWVGTHWLQILIAIGVASVIVIALHAIRRFARGYCERQTGERLRWGSVIARAVVQTGNVFMVVAAAKIVSTANFAGTPAEVRGTINFLWILVAGYQAAVWAREIIIGTIEHRTAGEHYAGEAIGSAMGIIRMLVGFAVFAIAGIVILDNLGVNVTGLVAGLGVGGIAIGSGGAGHLRRFVRGARDHFRPPVPARRHDFLRHDHGHRGEHRSEIDAHPRCHGRGTDHRQQAIARKGNPQHHAARLPADHLHAGESCNGRRSKR